MLQNRKERIIMNSLILRNKIASKAIILVLIMAIAIPPAAFGDQAACLAAKAEAIAAAQAQVATAVVAMAKAAAKVALAVLKALAAKKAYDECSAFWHPIKKIQLGKAALAAKGALDAAIANLNSAWNSLSSAYAALAAAQAIDCPPDPC